MFKSKKYKKLEEENKKLNDELNNKILYLNCTLEQIDILSKEINSLKQELKRESSHSIDLQKQISSLLDTNRNLIEWVQKILNEVGIQEVHRRTGVTIPIYKVERVAYNPDEINPNNFHIRPGYLDRQEIIIPELRFIKMGGN